MSEETGGQRRERTQSAACTPQSTPEPAARWDHVADWEARRIYSAIFRERIPPVVHTRFLALNESLNSTASPAELQLYYDAIQIHDDMEALELVARLTGRLPLLSRKFQAMAYLAETLPQNYAVFVNERSNLLMGLTAIMAGMIQTAGKLAKGLWMTRSLPRG